MENCRCNRCGVVAQVPCQIFSAQHRCALGLGDVVAKVTSAFGVKPCKPCEARKAALNARFPGVWRR